MALTKVDGVVAAFVDANKATVLFSGSEVDHDAVKKVFKRKKIEVLDQSQLSELPY